MYDNIQTIRYMGNKNKLLDFIIPEIEEITPEEPEYAEAKRLVEFLKYFEEVDEGLIPQNSLLREFVGGSIFGD